MNFSQFVSDVVASTASDEAKVFLLGVGLAAVVRMSRAGLRWLRAVSSD